MWEEDKSRGVSALEKEEISTKVGAGAEVGPGDRDGDREVGKKGEVVDREGTSMLSLHWVLAEELVRVCKRKDGGINLVHPGGPGGVAPVDRGAAMVGEMSDSPVIPPSIRAEGVGDRPKEIELFPILKTLVLDEAFSGFFAALASWDGVGAPTMAEGHGSSSSGGGGGGGSSGGGGAQ
ncbi:unnamed protein product [Discosporangium mesarthrocarpum]